MSPSETSSKLPKSRLYVTTATIQLFADQLEILSELRHTEVISHYCLSETLEFQFKLISDVHLEVHCFRKFPHPVVKRDTGYTLWFYITMVGFNEVTKIAKLDGDEDETYVIYETEKFKSFRNMNYTFKVYDLKVVIRMFEIEDLPIEMRGPDHVEEIYMKSYLVEHDKMGYLSYLLKVPQASDIFTGRLPLSFVRVQFDTTLRTIKYAEKIVNYLQAKERGDAELPNFPFEESFQFIQNGVDGLITIDDVVAMYTKAHHCGLDYLKELATDYFLTKMDDPEFVARVVLASDYIEDKLLFRKFLVPFLKYFNEIINSDVWNRILIETE